MPETRLWGRGERARRRRGPWKEKGRARIRCGLVTGAPQTSPGLPCAARGRKRRRGGRTCLLRALGTLGTSTRAPLGECPPLAQRRDPYETNFTSFSEMGLFLFRKKSLSEILRRWTSHTHTHAEEVIKKIKNKKSR